MKKCAKHTWKFRGIVAADFRIGMSHRMCSVCQAELYEWATDAEIRKHDPQGTIKAEMKRRGYGGT
jgi:hypothetical protein